MVNNLVVKHKGGKRGEKGIGDRLPQGTGLLQNHPHLRCNENDKESSSSLIYVSFFVFFFLFLSYLFFSLSFKFSFFVFFCCLPFYNFCLGQRCPLIPSCRNMKGG